MGVGSFIYYMIHFNELRAIIQWKTWHEAPHHRDPDKETASLRACFGFLDKTSRSFSAVIQELHPELLVPVAIFYLILRGLDTIEDDMTLPLEQKDPLLRDFHNSIEKENWTFDGNGPNEKDRDLLVKFYNVVGEFRRTKPAYRAIIKDITKKMGNGMADYCNNAEHNINGVNTIKDYDLYCHYVAGLVGEGLTSLFVESGLANPALKERPHLQESMGLFLQKTNIIRDVAEDWADKRRFWPKEIWSKHVDNFEDLFKPENKEAALNCSSEMVLNSLSHADECIFYLAGLKEQSVFNFAAIPQTMAIATLELVFRNPNIFEKNVKITKGDACKIMTESTQNLKLVCEVFRRYVRKIHKKNTPRDPNFLKISIACGKVEQFIETIYPSQSPKAIKEAQANGRPAVVQPQEERRDAMSEEAKWDTIFLLLSVMGIIFVLSALMLGLAWLFGARFDVAFHELKEGNFASPKDPGAAQSIIAKYDHGEL